MLGVGVLSPHLALSCRQGILGVLLLLALPLHATVPPLRVPGVLDWPVRGAHGCNMADNTPGGCSMSPALTTVPSRSLRLVRVWPRAIPLHSLPVLSDTDVVRRRHRPIVPEPVRDSFPSYGSPPNPYFKTNPE